MQGSTSKSSLLLHTELMLWLWSLGNRLASAAAVQHNALMLRLLLLLCACCRPDYMNTFVEKLIDWDSVGKRFEAATV
jgi:hypothetical protein